MWGFKKARNQSKGRQTDAILIRDKPEQRRKEYDQDAIARQIRIIKSTLATFEDRIAALRRDVNRIDRRDYYREAPLIIKPVPGNGQTRPVPGTQPEELYR